MPWGLAIGAAAGAIGSGLIGASSAQGINQKSIKLAREQMDFQERMSSTANQRAAADLEAAGLNRILALGRPATTPAGAQPPKLNVPGDRLAEGLRTATTQALSARRLSQEIKNMKAQEFLTYRQSAREMAQANQIQSQDALAQANTRVATQMERNMALQATGINTSNQIRQLNRQITALNIPGVQAESDFYQWLIGAEASEIAKAAGKAGPLALAFLKALSIFGRGSKQMAPQPGFSMQLSQ